MEPTCIDFFKECRLIVTWLKYCIVHFHVHTYVHCQYNNYNTTQINTFVNKTKTQC